MSIFLESCTKEVTDNSVVSDGIEITRERETEDNFWGLSPADYIVSREMVEAYVRDELGDRRASFTIDAHPSDNNPLVYVVNYEEGWKIIPGDSRFGLVLAESSNGHMDLSVESENPGFNLWIGNYKDQIEHAREIMWNYSKIDDRAQAWESYKAPRATELLAQYNYNIYQGMPVYEPDVVFTSVKYRMNWGYDGLYDDALYSETLTASQPWNTYYQNTVIEHSLYPGELTY